MQIVSLTNLTISFFPCSFSLQLSFFIFCLWLSLLSVKFPFLGLFNPQVHLDAQCWRPYLNAAKTVREGTPSFILWTQKRFLCTTHRGQHLMGSSSRRLSSICLHLRASSLTHSLWLRLNPFCEDRKTCTHEGRTLVCEKSFMFAGLVPLAPFSPHNLCLLWALGTEDESNRRPVSRIFDHPLCWLRPYLRSAVRTTSRVRVSDIQRPRDF